jgi:predicted amidohydrolase
VSSVEGTLRVAAIQLAPRFGDVEHNLERITRLVRAAAGADLIVVPELATTGYDLARLAGAGRQLAEPASGPTTERLHDLALDVGATLVVGFLEAGEGGSVYDSTLITSASTSVVYRKTHLYPPETDVFAAGDSLTTVPITGGITIGLMICFEHAFPEIATTLAIGGAHILVIPSAVPLGYEHVLTLRTRARAQDNQVFAVASNLTGGEFCGRSTIVDPRGEVIAEADRREGTIAATIDLGAIDAERRNEPALRLRRPALYG